MFKKEEVNFAMVWDKLTDWIADPHLEMENIDKYREILRAPRKIRIRTEQT